MSCVNRASLFQSLAVVLPLYQQKEAACQASHTSADCDCANGLAAVMQGDVYALTGGVPPLPTNNQ
jgi:hypothetical protein